MYISICSFVRHLLQFDLPVTAFSGPYYRISKHAIPLPEIAKQSFFVLKCLTGIHVFTDYNHTLTELFNCGFDVI